MSFLQRVNQDYFDGDLSPQVMELLDPLDEERPEVHQWIERMARLMQRQHFHPHDFHEGLAWLLGGFLGKILPGAWGGAVPPITLEGRHARVDDYLEGNQWRPLRSGDRFLDMGCGFPPMTTLDSHRRFPGVDITGADPSFGRFLIRASNGDYAAFTAEMELLYFQCGSNEAERWDALFSDPEATRERFRDVVVRARPQLPADDTAFGSTEIDDFTVLLNPILEFTTEGLDFRQQAIGSDFEGSFDVLRCFNVLCYFDQPFRTRAIEWAGNVLNEGGIFATGMNWTHSRHARYSVYRRERGAMVHKEYAFSVENIRPLEMVPWFTLHDDDYCSATLAELVRTVRSDRSFRSDFDSRMDELLLPTGLFIRRDDGYLGGFEEDADPETFDSLAETIGGALEAEGFNERAVGVLEAAGHTAWINCVGHIAVEPGSLTEGC
jgi:SAM-dependent methyltransferase